MANEVDLIENSEVVALREKIQDEVQQETISAVQSARAEQNDYEFLPINRDNIDIKVTSTSEDPISIIPDQETTTIYRSTAVQTAVSTAIFLLSTFMML